MIENSKRGDEHPPAVHTGVLAPVTSSSSVIVWAMVGLKKPIQPFFTVIRAIQLVSSICNSLSCVASVFVGSRRKDRPRDGIFDVSPHEKWGESHKTKGSLLVYSTSRAFRRTAKLITHLYSCHSYRFGQR